MGLKYCLFVFIYLFMINEIESLSKTWRNQTWTCSLLAATLCQLSGTLCQLSATPLPTLGYRDLDYSPIKESIFVYYIHMYTCMYMYMYWYMYIYMYMYYILVCQSKPLQVSLTDNWSCNSATEQILTGFTYLYLEL